jgi:hypothetical protein
MPNPRPALDRTRRRALTVLAGSPDGCTEAILMAHGFSLKLIAALIDAGLASAKSERMIAAGKAIAVTRVRITVAGRDALAGR